MYEDLVRGGKRELVRRFLRLERRLDDLAMPEISSDLVSPLLALPALRGAWVSSIASGGHWHDISGHGNHLIYRGNPTHNYAGVVPHCELDGTGDYFDITDAASGNDFDVSGTETYIAAAARGLTVMLWCYPEETTTLENLVAKWGVAGSRAYRLLLDASDQFAMRFSNDGTNTSEVTSSAVSMDAWYFAVGRVDPGSSVDVFVGSMAGLEETNLATARSPIFDTATNLNIGARAGGTEPFQGRVACVAVCACAVSDTIVSSTFNQMKGAFGV